jgi:hypothetical protein
MCRLEFFELCINHLFKPSLTWEELDGRVDQFKNVGRLVISNAPKIIHKLSLYSTLRVDNSRLRYYSTGRKQTYTDISTNLKIYMGSDSLDMWFQTEDPLIINLTGKDIQVLDRKVDGKLLKAEDILEKQRTATGFLFSGIYCRGTEWTRESWRRSRDPQFQPKLLEISSTNIRKEQANVQNDSKEESDSPEAATV